MSRFGKTLFGGSRFIFWSLAPVLARMEEAGVKIDCDLLQELSVRLE